MKCVACGNTGLVEGVASGYSTEELKFRPTGSSYFKAMFGIGMRPVHAHACPHCGHLHLSVEFSEEDLQRFLEFEGQQPGVIERINEGAGDADNSAEDGSTTVELKTPNRKPRKGVRTRRG